MQTARLNQYDILKGIGIILVMLGHAIPPNTYLSYFIYGFHMPLFFMCSGAFYKDVSIWQGFKKDFKGLLVPWLSFVLFLCLCALVIDRMSSKGFSPTFNFFDEHCWLLYYTIWFLVCLFITRQLYRILYKTCNRTALNVSCWGGYFVAFYLSLHHINIPFFIDSAMAMLLFYHVGYLFKNNKLSEQRPIWISAVLLIAYAVFVWLVHPYVSVKDNIYPIYLIVLSVIPIYALYQLSCRVRSKFLILCGVESLTIMGLHHPIYDTIMFPLMNRLPLPYVVEIASMVIITLFITLVLNKCIMRYAPFLLGKNRTQIIQ